MSKHTFRKLRLDSGISLTVLSMVLRCEIKDLFPWEDEKEEAPDTVLNVLQALCGYRTWREERDKDVTR